MRKEGARYGREPRVAGGVRRLFEARGWEPNLRLDGSDGDRCGLRDGAKPEPMCPSALVGRESRFRGWRFVLRDRFSTTLRMVPMRRFGHIGLCAALLTPACASKKEDEAKETKEAAQPEATETAAAKATASSELPDDALMLVTVPRPAEQLETLKQLAEKVSPGSGAALSSVDAFLKSVDLSKPIHVLVMDPQSFSTPWVVAGTVTDADALANALPTDSIETKKVGEFTVLGEAKTLEGVESWVASKLGQRPSPEPITMVFDPVMLGEKWRAFKPLILMGAQSDDSSATALLQPMLDMLGDFGAQVASFQIDLELKPDRFDMVFVLGAEPGSTLAKHVSEQRGDQAAMELLKKIWRPEDQWSATMSFGGAETRRAVADSVLPVLVAATSLDEAKAKSVLDTWVDIGGGHWAMFGRFEGPGTMKGGYLWELEDEAHAKRYIEEAMVPLFGSNWEMTDIAKFEGRGCKKDASVVEGSEVWVCEATTTFTNPNPQLNPAPQDMTLQMLVDGTRLLMAINEPAALTELKTRLDATEVPEPSGPFAIALERDEFGFMQADMTQGFRQTPVFAQALGDAESSYLEYGFGTRGDALTARMGMAAEDLAVFAGVMQTIAKSGGAVAPVAPPAEPTPAPE